MFCFLCVLVTVFGCNTFVLSFEVHFKELRGKKLVCLCFKKIVYVWILCLFAFLKFSVGSLSIDRRIPSERVKQLRGAVFTKWFLTLFCLFVEKLYEQLFRKNQSGGLEFFFNFKFLLCFVRLQNVLEFQIFMFFFLT